MFVMSKIRIAFAGLKGGIGKTTLSMVFGTILQETFKKKVCFIDGDYFQYPISAQNQRELMFIDRKPELVEEVFRQRGISQENLLEPSIFKMQSEYSLDVFEKVEKAYPDAEIYIYDMMGSQGYDDVFLFLTQMDYIILPAQLVSLDAKPTFFWMQGIGLGDRLVKAANVEKRLKDVFLLINQFPEDNPDLTLKAWFEDVARKESVRVLRNHVFKFHGAGRDLSSISEDNKDFFLSVRLQPSKAYMENSKIMTVVEEILYTIGVIDEAPKLPKIISDPFELYQAVVDDISSQIETLSSGLVNVSSDLNALPEKLKELVELQKSLVVMTPEEIKSMFKRQQVIDPDKMDDAAQFDHDEYEKEDGEERENTNTES